MWLVRIFKAALVAGGWWLVAGGWWLWLMPQGDGDDGTWHVAHYHHFHLDWTVGYGRGWWWCFFLGCSIWNGDAAVAVIAEPSQS
jgi:hypothetical protein